MNDISEWKYCNLEFENASKNSEDNCRIATEILYTGVWFLQNKKEQMNEAEAEKENLVYVLNIPKKYHDDQEVVDSQAKELDKWIKYEAFKEVDLDEQHVLGSRWVLVEKTDGTGR